MKKDNTTLWLMIGMIVIALWASAVDSPVDLNNNRCLESVGGSDQC